MNVRIFNRRALATVAVVVVAGTASAAAVGFAQGNGASSTPTTGRQAPSGILAGVHNTLEKLVTQGTINQQQADAVQQQANAGSIDPKTLVQRGVVSDAQMRAIGNSIDQVKRAAGN